MPSYKKYLITASLLFLFNGCSEEITNLDVEVNETTPQSYKKVDSKEFDFENQYVMFALEYEYQRKYNNSRYLYLKLFENTNRYEYLLKYLTLSFQLKDYISITNAISTAQIRGIKEEEQILRLNIFALLRLKKTEEALNIVKRLINVNKTDINYELLGTVYLELKEYDKSYDSFNNAFKANNSPLTLLSLTNIQYYYLKEKEASKRQIENYIYANNYDYNLCFQLLSFYELDKENDKVLALLNKMYNNYEMLNNKKLLAKAKNLLVRYLVKDDINKAIKFLEEKDNEDILLLTLYRSSNNLKKAYVLLEKLYKKTKKLDFLAQMAILEFEMASNKNDVLDSVISKFDKALATLDNSVYQNYLAYLLIDYDKDIIKGLSLVKKALEKEPKNLAYIDTLAWGEYKLNNCSEAYIQMKKVVDEVGFEDKEIKLHWEKIKECIK